MDSVEPVAGTPPSDAVPYDPSRGELPGASRWADYVTNLHDGGDRWWFYIRCRGEERFYTVLKNQVTSLRHVGLCGQWSLYYMVL